MTDTHFDGHVFQPTSSRCGWSNRYFIDTEFTDFEAPQLVSLAIVGENGSEFYGECTDFDPARCSDFVRTVVVPQLGRFKGRAMSFDHLRQALRAWIDGIPPASKPLLCYDYEMDLSLLHCLLGGSLPDGWALEDIQGQLDAVRRAAYYARHGGEHHALHDARANAQAYIG